MAVTYNCEGANITAQKMADVYAAILGSGTYISSLGNKMNAVIKDNNTIRVSDGVAFQEGRIVMVEASTYDDFTVPTGTQGTTVTYYIGYHIYTDSDGKEQIEQVVSTDKTASGSMRSGDTGMYIWLYSAVLNGLTLGSLITLATTIGSVAGGIPGITYGTTEPNDNDGMPAGSIYIKYEE